MARPGCWWTSGVRRIRCSCLALLGDAGDAQRMGAAGERRARDVFDQAVTAGSLREYLKGVPRLDGRCGWEDAKGAGWDACGAEARSSADTRQGADARIARSAMR